ncbi:MAG: GNAT family N-acetyltransferase [Chloroflexota bacterium]
MPVRSRLAADLYDLGRLAEDVYRADGYPTYRPTDLVQGFLVSSDAIEAWVAEVDGELVGHVALHHSSWEGVMAAAREATGYPNDQLAVVARLLVSPQARSRGLGTALLDAATAKAKTLRRLPILDVVTTYAAAVRLYEARGWHRIGTVDFPLPDGRFVAEHVYVSPEWTADRLHNASAH